MKKYFAFLLSVIFIMHAAIIPVHAAETDNEVYVTKQSAENIEILLNRLDIVTDSGNSEDAVPKGKFLEYIMNLLRLELVQATEQLFFDVPLTNEYADIVNTAYVMGIANGNGDGTLAVDTPVTANEAAAITVRALENICYVSGSVGDSFSEYAGMAAKLGLLDGVNALSDGTLNRGAVLRLIYNVLKAECIATDNWKDFYWDDTTFMEARYKISESKGIVEACQYGEIYGGNPLPSGQVKIGGETFTYDDIEAKKLLGHKVIFYYDISDNNSDEPEIIYMFSSGNKIFTSDTENIEYHKQGVLRYTDYDSYENAKLSENAVTILNGKRVAVGADGMQIPLYGRVTLVDNNNDGSYDVVLYNKYSLAVATGVNSDDRKIYSNSADYSLIELDEYDAYYIYDKDGKILDLTSVTENAVLNISENGDKSVIEITVCTDTVEFVLKGIRDENIRDYAVYYLTDENGNEYRTVLDFKTIYEDNSFITDSKSVALSSNYKFALNSDGKIAAVLKRSDASGYMYGYVINVLYDVNLYEESKLRILSENNDIKDYEVASKVKVINGSNSFRVTEEIFVQSYAAEGVVRFKTDENGEVCVIEFSQQSNAETGLRLDRQIADDENDSTRFYSSNNMIGGQIVVNEETAVFVIPSEEHMYEKDWYYAVKGTALVNQKYYPSSVSYKYDDDVYADVVIISSDDDMIKTAPVMLVESITSAYDPETDEVYKALSGYVNGNRMTYCIENGNYPSRASEFEAAEGDVIRFIINIKGHIGVMEPVFDYSESMVYNYDMSGTRRYAYNNSVCQVYGLMYNIYDKSYMSVTNPDDEEQFNYYYPITTETRFYEYDESLSRSSVKEITAEEVSTVKSGQVTTERVLIVTRDSATPLVVIYK